MNLNFAKINLAEARNEDGATVRSVDRELMEYERGSYKVPVEVFFHEERAIAYKPILPRPLPAGYSEQEIISEVQAGVVVNAECKVEWK